jgi:hypothetical protein
MCHSVSGSRPRSRLRKLGCGLRPVKASGGGSRKTTGEPRVDQERRPWPDVQGTADAAQEDARRPVNSLWLNPLAEG